MYLCMSIYKNSSFPFYDPCMNNLWASYIPLLKISKLDPDEHG